MTEFDEVLDVDELLNAPSDDEYDDDTIRGNCNGCSARWTGERICHCSRCHLTFTSVGPFDAHQRWNYQTEPARVKCLTPDELRDKGYEPNENDQWRKPRPIDTLPQKEPSNGPQG